MMKKLSLLMMLCLCVCLGNAQQVTLKDIARGTYRTEGIYGIKPMLDGEHYSFVFHIQIFLKSFILFAFPSNR